MRAAAMNALKTIQILIFAIIMIAIMIYRTSLSLPLFKPQHQKVFFMFFQKTLF